MEFQRGNVVQITTKKIKKNWCGNNYKFVRCGRSCTV